MIRPAINLTTGFHMGSRSDIFIVNFTKIYFFFLSLYCLLGPCVAVEHEMNSENMLDTLESKKMRIRIDLTH